MHGLKILAEAKGVTVTAVMEPHKEVLQDMIPPRKHLLRHQPANAQIGIMVRLLFQFILVLCLFVLFTLLATCFYFFQPQLLLSIILFSAIVSG